MIGAIGGDDNGKKLVQAAKSAGIDVKYQVLTNEKTGVCGVLIYRHEK